MTMLFEKKGTISYGTIKRRRRINSCDFDTYHRHAEIWTGFREDSPRRLLQRLRGHPAHSPRVAFGEQREERRPAATWWLKIEQQLLLKFQGQLLVCWSKSPN